MLAPAGGNRSSPLSLLAMKSISSSPSLPPTSLLLGRSSRNCVIAAGVQRWLDLEKFMVARYYERQDERDEVKSICKQRIEDVIEMYRK
jgi:hypothetical protein